MSKISWIWSKIPVAIRAVLVGMAVQILGIMPIFMLLQINVQVGSQIPWALIVGILYLWLFVGYIRGKGWPASTAEVRAEYFRMNPMTPEVRKWAYISGIFLSISIASMAIWGWWLIEWPTVQADMVRAFAQSPKQTILPLIVLAMVATGIIEESAYRGYMQVPVEKRHGPVIAIVLTSVVFALSHNLPGIIIPIFIIGSLGWGTLAYLANSNLPVIIFHALVDLPAMIWAIYNVDKLYAMLAYSVVESGPNNVFLGTVGIFLVCAAMTIVSLVKLAKARG